VGSSVACQRYLQRHIEPGLPDLHLQHPRWQQVLVVPAYRESATLLHRLAKLPANGGTHLVILVLNRPDSDPDPHANDALREALAALPPSASTASPACRQVNPHLELYVHDMDALHGPLPAAQGVGLARKTGCDLAFKWISQGAIDSAWICSGDADALLPPDYFSQLDAVPAGAPAAVFPFVHVAGDDCDCNAATALYELRLHHYVLGLEFAHSPCAWHSLGSCLAVRATHYAQVRGFPKRAGGEDFYLLDKLGKLGPISRLAGHCIELQSRHSDRAPFGTGPAVAKISAAPDMMQLTLFYHPACFQALGHVLEVIPGLYAGDAPALHELLAMQGQAAEQAAISCAILEEMGLAKALEHCRRQGKTRAQFLRQFHQWFDALRTLKFIHGLRDAGWPMLSLQQLQHLQPQLWPAVTAWEIPQLRNSAATHWGWELPPTSPARGYHPG